MSLIFALLLSDGYYVYSESLKLSLLGFLPLVFIYIRTSKIKTYTFIIFLILIAFTIFSCLIAESYMNVRYLVSQSMLLCSCYIIYSLSRIGKLQISQVEKFAKAFTLLSIANYLAIQFFDLDAIDKVIQLFASPSTSRLALETFLGIRVERLYFLSSEPSTHALSVLCLFILLNEQKRLIVIWKLIFILSILLTFSLSAMILLGVYYLLSIRLKTVISLGLFALLLSTYNVSDISTLNKLINIAADNRISQIYHIYELASVYPVDLEKTRFLDTPILSLWLYIVIANGYILGSLLLLIPLLPKVAIKNKITFIFIFAVIPISYFMAASILWWREKDETAHNV